MAQERRSGIRLSTVGIQRVGAVKHAQEVKTIASSGCGIQKRMVLHKVVSDDERCCYHASGLSKVLIVGVPHSRSVPVMRLPTFQCI